MAPLLNPLEPDEVVDEDAADDEEPGELAVGVAYPVDSIVCVTVVAAP